MLQAGVWWVDNKRGRAEAERESKCARTEILELKDEKRQLVSEPDSASDLILSATNMSKRFVVKTKRNNIGRIVT